jgi:spore maturation protein CgeB
VKCSGVGALDRELEAWVARVRGPRLRAFWDVDAADTLARVEADPAEPLRCCIPRYDVVFTYGGGQPVVERYAALGARACEPIYNGLDPDVHHPVASAPNLACDVVFMGNRLPDRERRVEALFLAVAERLPAHRFILGGNGWGDRALPPNVRWMGHVPTALHNAINCSARLVLNIHRQAMAQNGYSPATRMFEAAGAGACQITDAWPGIEHFFEPEREILVAEDAGDIARFVLKTPERRAREIGAAARARAIRDHSYAGRARQVDAVLGRLAERGSGGRS